MSNSYSVNILEVNNLRKLFPIKEGILGKTKGYVYAVDGVSFNLKKGETLGLVGESGCGKTTVGRCILRLIEPTEGEIIFNGVNITSLPPSEMRKFRREMQIVFQDPYASLNPRWTIKNIISEPLLIHGLAKRNELYEKVLELLLKVGLSEDHLYRFPHEFSGGQRQRICIAKALALKPKFIVLDEPTSSLDVSVQAQILNLLMDLQQELKLSYLFISHNLSVIKHVSNRIAVMYLGKIVELAEKEDLFTNQIHPYTKALFSAIPIPDPELTRKRNKIILKGDVPSPINPPSGCRFHPRCEYAMDICQKQEPKLIEVKKNHLVACFLAA
ncbi:MAG: dipeptide ABC transporter ATP-binding protein [Candidatus Bathyarchaeia archaeon]